MAGEKNWLSDEVAQRWICYTMEDTLAPTQAKLSARELEVLRLVVARQTNQEIGAVLHVSGKAVQKRLSGAYQKLSVTSRTEAVVTVMQQGQL
jgi:DNA-binding NarL/FixJ family response regulator